MSDLNDPRVFFAAERTLLAWNRTGLTLMAFGFMIERFGLFVQFLAPHGPGAIPRGFSYWVGLAFILLGSVAAAYACLQYRRVLRTLRPVEIPEGYSVRFGMLTNLAVAVLGLLLTVFLFGRAGI